MCVGTRVGRWVTKAPARAGWAVRYQMVNELAAKMGGGKRRVALREIMAQLPLAVALRKRREVTLQSGKALRGRRQSGGPKCDAWGMKDDHAA